MIRIRFVQVPLALFSEIEGEPHTVETGMSTILVKDLIDKRQYKVRVYCDVTHREDTPYSLVFPYRVANDGTL